MIFHVIKLRKGIYYIATDRDGRPFFGSSRDRARFDTRRWARTVRAALRAKCPTARVVRVVAR